MNEQCEETLRHSYATGLMESGVDLLTISRLLGHRSFSTTMIYLHVRRPHLERTVSPLDLLPVEQCPRFADPATPLLAQSLDVSLPASNDALKSPQSSDTRPAPESNHVPAQPPRRARRKRPDRPQCTSPGA